MTADELKSLRASLGLTQPAMAKLAMVSARMLQHWESGRYPMPAYRERLLRSEIRRIQRTKERK